MPPKNVEQGVEGQRNLDGEEVAGLRAKICDALAERPKRKPGRPATGTKAKDDKSSLEKKLPPKIPRGYAEREACKQLLASLVTPANPKSSSSKPKLEKKKGRTSRTKTPKGPACSTRTKRSNGSYKKAWPHH